MALRKDPLWVRSWLSLEYVRGDIERFGGELVIGEIVSSDGRVPMSVVKSVGGGDVLCGFHRVGGGWGMYEDVYAHALDKYFKYGVYADEQGCENVY